jgi:DNA-binding transcriptional LysR family regulator
MLFRSERHLVASPSYLAGRPPLRQPEDILANDCLVYRLPGESYTWRFRESESDPIREIGFKPRLVCNSGPVLLELARLGEGLVLLDDYTVHKDLAQGRLVRVLDMFQITNKGFDDGMYATILDTPTVPAKVRLFVEHVAQHVAGDQARFTAIGAATSD